MHARTILTRGVSTGLRLGRGTADRVRHPRRPAARRLGDKVVWRLRGPDRDGPTTFTPSRRTDRSDAPAPGPEPAPASDPSPAAVARNIGPPRPTAKPARPAPRAESAPGAKLPPPRASSSSDRPSSERDASRPGAHRRPRRPVRFGEVHVGGEPLPPRRGRVLGRTARRGRQRSARPRCDRGRVRPARAGGVRPERPRADHRHRHPRHDEERRRRWLARAREVGLPAVAMMLDTGRRAGAATRPATGRCRAWASWSASSDGTARWYHRSSSRAGTSCTPSERTEQADRAVAPDTEPTDEGRRTSQGLKVVLQVDRFPSVRTHWRRPGAAAARAADEAGFAGLSVIGPASSRSRRWTGRGPRSPSPG